MMSSQPLNIKSAYFWQFLMNVIKQGGVPSAIRTHGLQIRNLMLYPAELWGHLKEILKGESITKSCLEKEQSMPKKELKHTLICA